MNLKLLWLRIKKNALPFLFKPEDFNDILRLSGIHVGKRTIFYGNVEIDRSRPYLLHIGDYCKITTGVTILTHDYSRSVLRRVYGDVVGEGKTTVIGNNVFVGMNSTILMGTHVGNNVIIGANSVVSGSIPDNVVVAGNPARVVRSLDDHYKLKKQQMLRDAKECAQAFYLAKHTVPTVKDMDPFWPLFMKRDRETLLNSGVQYQLNGDEPEEVIKDFVNSDPPVFSDFDAFLDFCEIPRG